MLVLPSGVAMKKSFEGLIHCGFKSDEKNIYNLYFGFIKFVSRFKITFRSTRSWSKTTVHFVYVSVDQCTGFIYQIMDEMKIL
jgi:hypothetical protein